MTINYAKHKNILLQILKDIYLEPSIAPHLGFKGGTAAHLFYGLNRDSFDLDFDLLNEDKQQIVFEKIKEIIDKYGKIVDSNIKKFNLLNIISYNNKSQNIKVEVNRRKYGSQYELKTLLGISMLVMVKEDMFAHKLMAMLERVGKTSRDVYDVWYFLKNNWSINKEIVEKRSGLSFNAVLKNCIVEIEKLPDRNLLFGLGESLTDSQKDWARAKLKTEIIFLLKLRLEN
ncbi:MAG: nucleotidyl transferase AbiEii/AbiGii toxin family protein [Candidatus Pacebacteria bacterium]|nr:nucleotidyl transferase AbiEii/AbiGii toxin family protein [Candidatus Paceibacterota bacterium]